MKRKKHKIKTSIHKAVSTDAKTSTAYVWVVLTEECYGGAMDESSNAVAHVQVCASLESAEKARRAVEAAHKLSTIIVKKPLQ